MKVKKDKRFTVSLPEADYERLKTLAETAKPPVSFHLLVNVAIDKLLEQAEDPERVADLWNPFRTRRKK